MKNKRIPVAVITGPYNSFNHSNTVVTFTDESERDIPVVNSDNYTIIQAIYAPKGVTNEWVLISGTDIVRKYLKLFGMPHTAKYGPMATYAYAAVLGKFNLAVINVRPPEATHANTYLSFDIHKAMKEGGETADTKKLYGILLSDKQEYHFSFDKAEVEKIEKEASSSDEIKEIDLEYFNLGFVNYTIEDLKDTTDVDDYLDNEIFNVKVDKGSTIADTVKVHVPQIFLAYRGSGDYGNIYKMSVSNMTEMLNGTYPYFNGVIKDAKEDVYSFSFSMFDTSVGLLNYGFEDRATNACKRVMSATNHIQEFRAWSLKRKNANKAEAAIVQALENTKAYLLAKIKEKYPLFDETTSTSNLEEFYDALNSIREMFKRNKETSAGIGRETPFSFVNPWSEISEDISKRLLLKYMPAPKELQFAAGSLGPLGAKLDEEDFSWDTTLTKKVPNPDTGTPEDTEYKVWEELLNQAYSGETDDSLFDSSIVPDGILFGEQYPVSVQETIDKLCKYQVDVVNCETVRPDFCYIRTPENSVNTMQKIYDWQDGFLNFEKKNLNMHPVVGSWRYVDISTGAQERFSGFYDYIGEGSILFDYLFSCTSKSFASGDYSIITKGATNSQLLVPRTSGEREELKNRDIMYFKRRSNGMYALGEDTGYAVGKDTVLKSIGSNVQFNRIMNIAMNIMRDNAIIDPTTDELDNLQRKIQKAIANPSKHFKDKVSVTIGKSTHANEIDRNVILCEIRVTGNEYSRYNRLHMIAQRPAE